jgi:hypothetical protein
VFVANPSKPQPIIDILANNKEKLLKYLEDFHTDRGGLGADKIGYSNCYLSYLLTLPEGDDLESASLGELEAGQVSWAFV